VAQRGRGAGQPPWLAGLHHLHANVYIIKPIDLDQFIDIVHAIEGFWFSVVKVPQMYKRKGLT
jgi:hypothetical protein